MKKPRKRPGHRRTSRLICLLLLAGICVLLFTLAIIRITSDTTPPVITFPSAKITYTPDEDVSALLADVTATDDKDGDVTESIRVRSISISDEGGKAIVTYVAKDQANNVGLEKRVVKVNADKKTPKDADSQEAEG